VTKKYRDSDISQKFYRKLFQIKVVKFKKIYILIFYQFDLKGRRQDQDKIILNFLNKNHFFIAIIFLLHSYLISRAFFQNYNEIPFD